MWPALIVFAPFFAMLFFFGMRRPKSCPNCGESLPATQSPFSKSMRQWWEGGHTCQKCGCESDTAGRIVPAGTPPREKSIVLGISMIMLAAIPGALFVLFLL